MRFKVGDIVRVKPDLNLSNQYKGYIVETNSGEYKKSYLVKIPGYDGHDGFSTQNMDHIQQKNTGMYPMVKDS